MRSLGSWGGSLTLPAEAPCRATAPNSLVMRDLLHTGAVALLGAMIMFVGSLGLWLGTPLVWLWVGSQVEGETSSLSLALLVMAVGVLLTVWAATKLLTALSSRYRSSRVAQGHADPGHGPLEAVLVASAGVATVVFSIWFLLFAGASPVPIGLNF